MNRRTMLSTLLSGLPAGWVGGAYASDAPETSAAEIKLWFPDGVVDYTRDIDRWMSEDKAPS